MGIWNGTKKVTGHLVNARVDKWIAYRYLKDTLHYIFFILKSLTKPEQAHIEESFQEAIERLNLSQKDLEHRAKQLKIWRLLFLGISFGLLLYAFYTFKLHNWMGTGMTLALMLYAGYQAFRFHFWHYQLQQQRFGCTLRESLDNRPQRLRKNP